MDTLLNAGMAAGFAAAKGKVVRVKGMEVGELNRMGAALDAALVELSATSDIVWVDVQSIVRNAGNYSVCAFIYYTER